MSQFVKVAQTLLVPEGAGTCVDVQGKKIAIFKVDGKFYALDNSCGHRGGPLSEGSLDGNAVACPWHGFVFDVTTGNCATNPALQQSTYKIKVEGSDLLVEIPTQTS